MALSQAQLAMVERSRAIGGGTQGVALSESACAYILAAVVADLDLKSEFPELPAKLPAFFGGAPIASLEIPGVPFLPLLDRLVGLSPDADTYFASLAKLHKSRLKYERILNTQPIATMEQVGPRALLEFGKLGPQALVSLLLWRKWMFDIDNRAAQETGYLFEPIIAGAIGGVPAGAARSPVHRRGNPGKGRQVDCIKGNHAYEFKLRVTTAASGQGRWREELDFPHDCRESGFVPVLGVLDATPNPKLREIRKAFESENGEVYVGEAAWKHLDEMAGPTMAMFLQRYVRGPIRTLLEAAPRSLPSLALRMGAEDISVGIGNESFKISRKTPAESDCNAPPLPDDADEEAPGP